MRAAPQQSHVQLTRGPAVKNRLDWRIQNTGEEEEEPRRVGRRSRTQPDESIRLWVRFNAAFCLK